jgi:HTH-type transcriptional regulator/antitoxin HigA
MDTLKYKVIKSDEQYFEYANRLEELVRNGLDSQEAIDEYELLYLLIRTWDDEHRFAKEMDPVELIKSLKKDHELSQNELAEIADIGKSYISEILNYKKRMSKKVIRNLAEHFKIQQSALNQEYRLEGEGKFEEMEEELV